MLKYVLWDCFCYRVRYICVETCFPLLCCGSYSLLMLMFQHSREAAVRAGWVAAVGSRGVGSLCGPCVSFQGIWAHSGEGSCCLQAVVVEDQWVV